MVSYGKSLSDQMLTTKHFPRPSNMLLKDYLRDDLSSCSSSGFKSFPRRQCCTTVRLDLLQKDLQAKRSRLLRPSASKQRSSSSSSFKAASSTLSALHKASQAVINAVKLLPFPSISTTPASSKKRKSKRRLLSKSLPRKVLSRSFWRKAVKEERSHSRQWRSFRDFLEEGDKPLYQNAQSSSINSLVTFGSSSCAGSGTSNSESSNKSNGNSRGSSEFTWEILRSSSANSTENDVVGSKENALNKTAVKVGEDPTDGCTLCKAMDWGSEEKEQFSPVSVLDCPFKDDEEINSPLDSTCSRVVEGSKHKHLQKSRHFDCIASLKPEALENRMALSEMEEEPYKPRAIKGIENEKSKEDEKAWRLVDEVRNSIPSKCLIMSKAEKKLLLDFFKQSSEECIENIAEKEGQLSKVAEKWLSGESQQVNLGWEMHFREMDKCGRWTNISEEEWEQVGMKLEFEIFTSLVNELVLELTS